MIDASPNTIHLMVDIETAGRKAGCPILQLAAIPFGPDCSTAPCFNQGASLQSNELYGLKASEETLTWWQNQAPLVRERVFGSQGHLEKMLEKFSTYVGDLKRELGPEGKVVFWCCGVDFDKPILEVAFEVCNLTVPWKYYEWRDYRTIREQFALPEHRLSKLYKIVEKHDALEDCKYQAIYLEEVDALMEKLSNGKISLF